MKNVPGSHAARGQALAARGVLALAIGLLVAMVSLGGTSGAGDLVLAASASPSPTGPSIKLLNPSAAYDPHIFPENQDPSGSIVDPPKVSDKFDGIDNLYHIVAAVASPPPNAIIEASIQYPNANEITIGELSPIAGSSSYYDLFWDIPESLSSESATIVVHLFSQTGSGFDEVATDSVDVDMQFKDDPPDEPDETIQPTWPTANGPLGFYKGHTGPWRAFIEGFTSDSTVRVQLEYSTTPPGKDPKFTLCSGQITPGSTANSRKAWSGLCTLAGKDLPGAVTSIAVVAEDIDNTHSGLVATASMDSADVFPVQPYVQTTDQMAVTLIPVPSGSMSNGNGDKSDRQRDIDDRCLAWVVDVADQLHRPVVGVNVDVHIQGPTDQLQFGDDTAHTGGAAGTYKNPDKASHSTGEGAVECSSAPDGTFAGTQAEHNVPGGPDIKHRESLGGTGVGGAAGPGQWKFYFFSDTPGFTDITAWADDAPVADPTETRAADDDVLGPGEAFATARAQWYSQAPTLDFVPLGDAGPAGTCRKFQLKARAGNAAIPGANVDIHAQGPDDGIRFCDPGGGSSLSAPDKGDHDPIDGTQSSDKATSPKTVHAETNTNDQGNVTLGIVSPTTGDTKLTAWMDGQAPYDDDVPGSTEPKASATMSWTNSSGDASVSFVNPSPYGDVTRVSNKPDADEKFHIVMRVDAPSLVQGVEVQLGTGTGADFVKTGDLGQAVQVSGTDTYELFWPATEADGSYTLRAHIIGTNVVKDQTITLNSKDGAVDPRDVADETVEMTKPIDAQPVAFLHQSTPVEGIASAGAEGIDLFYTKAAANATLASTDWIGCGFVDLDGTGSTAQTFKSTCQLQGADQAGQVTGIAALPFDCQEPAPGAGCDVSLPTGDRNLGASDSGDAHRIFGFEANPLIGMSPAENEKQTGDCAKFVVHVSDQTGQALLGENVDVHLTGPGDTPNFCDPADGSASPRRAPDQGGHSVVAEHGDQGAHVSDGPDTQHTEGETNGQGNFVFGVKGNEAGDSTIVAWLDRNDNDFQDDVDPSGSSLMHWIAPSSCTQVGTAHADVLTGTPGVDRICGRGGNDVIKGRGGNDVLLGSSGDDVVKGGPGRDKVNGGIGNDRLFGNAGNDALRGNAGTDRLNGGGGRDSCRTGPGRDRTSKCESGGSKAPSRIVRGGAGY